MLEFALTGSAGLFACSTYFHGEIKVPIPTVSFEQSIPRGFGLY
jgi:hypothetical protein